MTNDDQPKHSLEIALVESLDSSSLRDLTADLAEVTIDQLIEAGPFRDIPILGTLVKAKASIGLVRDYVFMKKVAKFLMGLAEIPEEQRRTFMQRVASRGETKKLGEVLLILLDRLDDFDKPALLAKVFRAYLTRNLPLEVFRRLGAAIERLPVGSVEALRTFYSPKRQGIETGGEFLSEFASVGLVGIEFYPTRDIAGGYEPTELGKLLQSIIDEDT